MNTELIIQMVGRSVANGLEVFGVLIIGGAFLHAVVKAIFQFRQGSPQAFVNLKIYLGKALQLALEFLVAADVIRTVTVEMTMESLLLLGMLIVLRTMLSWSITVEIEGRWPWQTRKE